MTMLMASHQHSDQRPAERGRDEPAAPPSAEQRRGRPRRSRRQPPFRVSKSGWAFVAAMLAAAGIWALLVIVTITIWRHHLT